MDKMHAKLYCYRVVYGRQLVFLNKTRSYADVWIAIMKLGS